MRKLLEVTHEAWVDSGVDYRAMRGSARVGVYLGCCGSEVHAMWLSNYNDITGYEPDWMHDVHVCQPPVLLLRLPGPLEGCGHRCSSGLTCLPRQVRGKCLMKGW